MDWQYLFFSYQGRINRGKYWLAALVFLVIGLILYGIFYVIASGAGVAVGLIAAGIVYIVLLVSSLSVAIKRLHDRDKSGWWILLFYIVPGIVSGIGSASGVRGVAIICGLISLVIGIWAFVELGCLRGTVGPNQYGPDPLEGLAR